MQRESGIREDEDSGNRYSLDHLYVDSAGVPTLVEVKRSSDTRLRREVVAQMLDYAANAGVSFTVASMAARVDEAARGEGSTGAEALADQLGVDDPEAFWETVSTNLEEQRFRLVFVSDVIPTGLRNVIEFLNDQMTRTDVLAIKVKQYVDANGQHQTIVPQVIGNTEKAKAVKRRTAKARRDVAARCAPRRGSEGRNRCAGAAEVGSARPTAAGGMEPRRRTSVSQGGTVTRSFGSGSTGIFRSRSSLSLCSTPLENGQVPSRQCIHAGDGGGAAAKTERELRQLVGPDERCACRPG